MTQTLNPKNDIVFKCLFGKPEYEPELIRFLTAVIKPKATIEHAKVLNPGIPINLPSNKGIFLDLRVELSGGAQVDVEMQLEVHTGLSERFLYYWARMFTAQIGKGGEYSSLKPGISVVVLGESLLPGKRFHSTFHVSDDDDHHHLTEHLEFHVLELPKIDAADTADDLAGWGRFFTASSDEERREVGMTYPNVAGTIRNLEELSKDEELRQLALQRELDWATEKIMRGAAYDEGRKDGEEQGRKDGHDALRDSTRILARVLGLTLTPEQTSQLERMSLAELRSLIDHLERERRFP